MPYRAGMTLDWDKLRVFHAVAEAGSFTHAGDTLNLSQSAVSRQISGLEESLGVALFHRHARGLIPTEQGENLYRTVHEVFAKLAMTEAQITESKERPSGPLRITTAVAFGSIWLTPRMKAFQELCPDIQTSLILTDDELDLSMREADVAIRMGPPRQPDLVQRHLMSMHYHVYASPEYLHAHGIPQTPADLDKHKLIAFGDESQAPVARLNWILEAGVPSGRPRDPALEVNNIYGIFRAVQSGLGIAALPDYFGRESGDLVEILPELHGPTVEVYFVYPEELRNSQRIAAFRDFLVRKINEARV
mgnify:CR=1 FL=1